MFRTVNDELGGLLGNIFTEVEKNVREKGALLTADIKETANGFVVSADAPGVKKEDIKITFENGILKIETPERSLDKLEEGEKMIMTQRSDLKKVGHFKFKQSIDQDSIKAAYRDGVLIVEVQKKDKDNTRIVVVE